MPVPFHALNAIQAWKVEWAFDTYVVATINLEEASLFCFNENAVGML